MSVVQRARAKYYEVGGYPLSSLNVFDVQEAKRTNSLQYLQQVTNLCEKIKISPEQFAKQSPSNKLKFIKAFQYSILYSRNLKSIYDSKEQELTQRNTLLIQQLKQKKQAIKVHKQKVQKRKAQYRQTKVNQAKSVYQTFSHQISNLKSKQQELNSIKMQLQSDIQLAKHQLNFPHPIQGFPQQPQMSPNFQQSAYDPAFHLSSQNSLNSNPNLYSQNNLNFPHFSTRPQGLVSFNMNQNTQNKQKTSKHQNQSSNFTLNQQWTIIDEQNRIQDLQQEKQQKKDTHYKIKVSQYEKQDKKNINKFNTKDNNNKLTIDTNKIINKKQSFKRQTQELYSPTINLKINDQLQNNNKKPQEDSFDDLNSYVLGQKSSNKSSKLSPGNKSSLTLNKQQNKQASHIKEDDSLLLKKLNIESKVSKKSSNNYDQYQLQDQIKQTPNLKYSFQSNNDSNNDLTYSKTSQISGDLWNSSKALGSKNEQNMKMFNFQPKRKSQDDVKNSVSSINQIKQSQNAYKQIQKQVKHENSENQFDDLDDIDLGMQTRNSIIQIKAKEQKSKQQTDIKKIQNPKKTLQVSIHKIQQVSQQTESDITKKGSIPNYYPVLDKTQEKDYGEQQDYDYQFQDQLQQSKSKAMNLQQKKIQKDMKKNISNNKSQVQIIVPSNTSLADDTVTSKQPSKLFKDLPIQAFQTKEEKFKNNAKGIFPDLQLIIDNHSEFQVQQSRQNDKNLINTDQLLQDCFDIPEQTTFGKKPKIKVNQLNKSNKNNLDQSNKLLVFQNLLESINPKQPATTQIIQSTTFNNSSANNDNKLPIQKKVIDNTSLTESIPLKKTIQRVDTQQIIQQDEDEISEEIQYQFEDSSKVIQSEKQQIQKKIISIIRNKNKNKNNLSSSSKINNFQKQIQQKIDQQIQQNLKSTKSKTKSNNWKQITNIFQNKINQLKKQSPSSQVQKKLNQIQQKNTNIKNTKNNQRTSIQNSNKNQKPIKYQVQESDENFDLNYSQSLMKDQLKTQFKNKKKLELSDVASLNQVITNSSKFKDQSSNFQDSGDLGFSLKQKSFIGLKNLQKQQQIIDPKKTQNEKLQQQKETNTEVRRDNRLMGMKQEIKTQQASRSKYVKSITPKNNKSVSKQSALTKLQQNKYVTIEDPLNNQIALKKPVLTKKVSEDDDDF